MCVGIDLAMQDKPEQNKTMLLNNILLTYKALCVLFGSLSTLHTLFA